MKNLKYFVFLYVFISCNTEAKEPQKETLYPLVNRKQEQISLFVNKANRALSQGDTSEAIKYFKICLDVDTANDARMKEYIEYSLNNLKSKK